MKRFLAFALAAVLTGCLALPAAAVGTDLSALSWDELIALKAEINKELTTRDEWQEVVVPQGVWVVGEDIPEGKWTVQCAAGSFVKIAWSYALADNGHSIKVTSNSDSALIYSKKDAGGGDMVQYTFDAKSGMYVCIDFSSAEFTPYTGKQSLGFK